MQNSVVVSVSVLFLIAVIVPVAVRKMVFGRGKCPGLFNVTEKVLT